MIASYSSVMHTSSVSSQKGRGGVLEKWFHHFSNTPLPVLSRRYHLQSSIFPDLPVIPDLIINQLENTTIIRFHLKAFSLLIAPFGFDDPDFQPLTVMIEGSWPFGVRVAGVTFNDGLCHRQRPSKFTVESSPTFRLFGQPLTAACCPISEFSRITLDTCEPSSRIESTTIVSLTLHLAPMDAYGPITEFCTLASGCI